MVDLLRYSMIGVKESNPVIGLSLIISLSIILFFVNVYLFKIGYKLRT